MKVTRICFALLVFIKPLVRHDSYGGAADPVNESGRPQVAA
jgi:hypothetical protein